ncbi:MAG: hypothetical protein JXB49_11560 [Bacteroidales bacterium]|nr:hypothetical protein [Bacteroidales bacterium]
MENTNKNNRAKVVFRIEIATLLDEKGTLNLKKMERLAMLVTNLNNSGVHPLIVSSGAIFLGSYKLKRLGLPDTLTEKQAIAAIGQAELIRYYQDCFSIFHQFVAQVLLTSDVINHPERNKNAKNTFFDLLDKNIIPVINENDSVSTDDIELDDNYPLALNVAAIVDAEFIILKLVENGKFLLLRKNQPDNHLIIGETELIENLHEQLADYVPGKPADKNAFPLSVKGINNKIAI